MDQEKIKRLLAPDRKTKEQFKENLKDISAYLIIGIVLLIITVVVPIISGGVTAEDFGYYLPKSAEGWIVFWLIRGGTVLGNIIVFILFKKQARINVRHNENYLKANELLNKQNGKKGFIPESPKHMLMRTYSVKITSVIIITGLESVVIGVLALNFDFVTFLSCITSSITAVLFGWWAMIVDETWWTDDYLLYAEYVEKKNQEDRKEEECQTSTNNLENTPSIQMDESSLANQTDS